MIRYPHFDPIAFKIGAFQVHWYGVMYLVGFIAAWLLALYRIRRKPWNHQWNSQKVADLIFYSAIGVIIGGRLGYMLFYSFPDLIAHPWIIFKIWQGGMSFHGGLIGVIVSLFLYSRLYHIPFFDVTDFIAPMTPIGLGVGRLGNFINGYLYGRVTTVPWGMIFPNSDGQIRHPSPLYEFLLEGVLLFILLWWYSSKPRPQMATSGLFLLAYGLFRIFCELFREPDRQLGFIAFGWLTMGQLLSIPMIIIGIILIGFAYGKHKNKHSLNKGR